MLDDGLISLRPLRQDAEPGSTIIRPTREDIEREPKRLFEMLQHRRQRQELPLKMIADLIGDTGNHPATTGKRFFDSGKATEKEVGLVLHHFYERLGKRRQEMKNISDALYFAFLNAAMVRETSQDKARARSIGSYRFWRQSVEHDDEYIFGKIVFSEVEDTGALRAEMTQVRQPSAGHSRAEENFSGYLFRISHLYLMMLFGELSNDARFTFFTHRRETLVGTDINPRSPFPGKIPHNISMDGHVFGVDGQKKFFAPLHLSLVDDVDELGQLDTTLDIIKETSMPERVLKKLKGMGKLQIL